MEVGAGVLLLEVFFQSGLLFVGAGQDIGEDLSASTVELFVVSIDLSKDRFQVFRGVSEGCEACPELLIDPLDDVPEIVCDLLERTPDQVRLEFFEGGIVADVARQDPVGLQRRHHDIERDGGGEGPANQDQGRNAQPNGAQNMRLDMEVVSKPHRSGLGLEKGPEGEGISASGKAFHDQLGVSADRLHPGSTSALDEEVGLQQWDVGGLPFSEQAAEFIAYALEAGGGVEHGEVWSLVCGVRYHFT